MKVVINKCYGGFGISAAVRKELGLPKSEYCSIYNEDLGIKSSNYNAIRSDKRLINAIEKIGIENSHGDHAKLKIVEIPDGIDFYIDDYDGIESIHQTHQSWE